MAKTRVPIGRALREQVLAEFYHRCAICGTDRPQLHHIDENPSNNELRNLLPLCPNCHLIDQHNPTAPIDPAKLRLFRQFKDPVILSPQFHPLFRRFSYLLDLDESLNYDQLRAKAVELIAFINALQVGGFYHTRIADLIDYQGAHIGFLEEPEHVLREKRRQRDAEFRQKLLKNREEAVALIIEMLRYQDWPSPRELGSLMRARAGFREVNSREHG